LFTDAFFLRATLAPVNVFRYTFSRYCHIKKEKPLKPVCQRLERLCNTTKPHEAKSKNEQYNHEDRIRLLKKGKTHLSKYE
jgi:hypothetical protein